MSGESENLEPGEEACFVEHWHLLPMAFPAEGMDLDLQQMSELVEATLSTRSIHSVPGYSNRY